MHKKKQRTLEEDYRYCEQIIKKHSKSFYYGFSRLPEEQANAVYAVYAFCRIADDAVDATDDREEQVKKIELLEKDLRRFQKENLSNPVWNALRDIFERYPMDIAPFFDQLKGQRMDINFKQPETLEELEEYSTYVAGSVGLMLMPILAPSSSKENALNLGIAMQLTNVLRDVGEDYEENQRIYLPRKMMEEEGWTEEKLQNKVTDDRFIHLWERIAKRAEELYDRFPIHIEEYTEESRLPVLVSVYVYRGILDAVRKQQYDCLTRRAAVSGLEKERLYRKAKKDLKNMRLPLSD